MNKILMIGGDLRSCYMGIDLKKNGYEVYFVDPFDEKLISEADITTIKDIDSIINDGIINCNGISFDVAVLPVPVSRDGLNVNSKTGNLELDKIKKVFSCIKLVSGGVIPESFVLKCQENKIEIYDFIRDDRVARKNAVATAEGAIFETFMASHKNICGEKCLVTGYGRCGSILAEKLRALGASVTVAVRSLDSKCEAKEDGFDIMDIGSLSNRIGDFDLCFNTVPAPVLTEDVLKMADTDLIIMDIASKPGGTDFEYCKMKNIKAIHSLGIPGKYSPKTSGEILSEALIRFIQKA